MARTMLRVLTKGCCDDEEFYRETSRVAADLYRKEFGPGMPVTPQLVRDFDIRHVLWIEDEGVAAATMVCLLKGGKFRVMGIAVRDKRKGYGTSLMQEIDRILSPGSTLLLGVDNGKESTQWLLDWYERLGFEIEDYGYDETILVKYKD